MRKHDVIVIGGSLAGAACVRELERLGIDAVAFERDRFPRDKVCGGFVSPGGVKCLDRLGVLNEVRTAGATEVRSVKIRVDSVETEFPLPGVGLGISRKTLDAIVARNAPVQQHCAVASVSRTTTGFAVSGPEVDAVCKIVIDAAGKLSRLTPRVSVDEFGVNFSSTGTRLGVLDFWFFQGGYGGGVSVEGGCGNYCFMIRKERLKEYINRPGCLVTGPLSYDHLPGEFIAIGDAAGMVDPFCGEGMRHALDTGIVAAAIVARGLRAQLTYEEIRRDYELEWNRRWLRKRVAGGLARRILRSPRWKARVLAFQPVQFLNWFWV